MSLNNAKAAFGYIVLADYSKWQQALFAATATTIFPPSAGGVYALRDKFSGNQDKTGKIAIGLGIFIIVYFVIVATLSYMYAPPPIGKGKVKKAECECPTNAEGCETGYFTKSEINSGKIYGRIVRSMPLILLSIVLLTMSISRTKYYNNIYDHAFSNYNMVDPTGLISSIGKVFVDYYNLLFRKGTWAFVLYTVITSIILYFVVAGLIMMNVRPDLSNDSFVCKDNRATLRVTETDHPTGWANYIDSMMGLLNNFGSYMVLYFVPILILSFCVYLYAFNG